ncbi:Clavaminate synthase-like protein [Aspergillus sclerotioniger CBS 115572]|uniref:Clavaminate synthase-like protein n=1 Tax=Aspergillus sclerotioniger CBS 115572 TaxID=1450535 RepID=A0A317XE62_9EURO|nr:Clavaminate synthase-like protein [Aspergillus sclerotioniger CBS 115572]PWY96615.1 Clavaminate synthase-like protein [Aspergillus sclerotioniger CBS 115572]
MLTNTLPRFPSDIPTAPLLRLSLSKLQSHDITETHRLLQACEEIGFFYLDLQDTNIGNNLLTLSDELFSTTENLFSLSLDEKRKYVFTYPNCHHGYRIHSAGVVDREGIFDVNELYNISKTDILNLTPPLPAPPLLHLIRPTLKSFIHTSHSIITLLLTLLNSSLSLPDATLPKLHSLTALNDDQVRFVKSSSLSQPSSTPKIGRQTDFSSLAILFSRPGGLQVLPPGQGAEWAYVEPLPGHVIVNLGDAMAKFTKGMLLPSVYRVVRLPGEPEGYSLGYCVGVEDEIISRKKRELRERKEKKKKRENREREERQRREKESRVSIERQRKERRERRERREKMS